MESFPTLNPVTLVSVTIRSELPTTAFLETRFAFAAMGLLHPAFRFGAEIETLTFLQT